MPFMFCLVVVSLRECRWLWLEAGVNLCPLQDQEREGAALAFPFLWVRCGQRRVSNGPVFSLLQLFLCGRAHCHSTHEGVRGQLWSSLSYHMAPDVELRWSGLVASTLNHCATSLSFLIFYCVLATHDFIV